MQTSTHQTIVMTYSLKEQYIKLLKLIYVCIALCSQRYFQSINQQT